MDSTYRYIPPPRLKYASTNMHTPIYIPYFDLRTDYLTPVLLIPFHAGGGNSILDCITIVGNVQQTRHGGVILYKTW